jgi:hypothetical protein
MSSWRVKATAHIDGSRQHGDDDARRQGNYSDEPIRSWQAQQVSGRPASTVPVA